MKKQEAYKSFRCFHCEYLDHDKGICLYEDHDSEFCNKGLIRRYDVIKAVDKHTTEDGKLDEDISVILEEVETVFDKQNVLDQIERQSKLYSLSDRDCEFAIPQNIALEIVKNGGI